MESKNDRLSEMQVQLNDWENEIEKLKAQAETEAASAIIQLKYYKLIEILRSRQEEVRGKLAKLKLPEDDDWKDLKKDIGSSWKNIKSTLSDTGEAFKNGLEEKKKEKK
jgi:hypothetical protein